MNISNCAVSISEEHALDVVEWCQCFGCSWLTRMQRRRHFNSRLQWCRNNGRMIGLASINLFFQRFRTHLFAVCSPLLYTCYFKHHQLFCITMNISLHSHVPDVSVHSGSFTGMERTIDIAAVRSLPNFELSFLCLNNS